MAPLPPTNRTNLPISIPRAEHLSLPLSPSLRSQLSAHIMDSGTVKRLRETMDARCREAGWQQAVHDRTMQLLREGNVGSWKELEEAVVREAMGKEEEGEEGEEEEEEEEEKAWEWKGHRQEGEGGKSIGKVGRVIVVKVADVELPEMVKKEGWKIVREGVESAEVMIEEELTDGWIV